ncbi:unnamed protein product [Mytilus edulis]|uniref:Uncharacterized protein n=1 Tax=Mytilus edulis TaxID=6550 RepID=A0A8S3SIN8_MYTED|nr:unnamed protein product [Mytilus edulis]
MKTRTIHHMRFAIMTTSRPKTAVKRPRYAAVYFPEEQQTSIIPSCKLRDWEFEDQQTVTVVWDGAECPAKIIKLSDDRAELEEAEDRFVEQHVTPANEEVSDDEIIAATPNEDKTNPVKESDFSHLMRSIGIKTNVVKLSRSVIHHVDIPPMFTNVASHLEELPSLDKLSNPASPVKPIEPPASAQSFEPPASAQSFEPPASAQSFEPPSPIKLSNPTSPAKLSNPPSPANPAETQSRGAKVNQRLQESRLSLNLSEFDISMLNQQLDSSRLVSIENTVKDIHSLLLKWQCVKPTEVPPSTNKVKTVSIKESVTATTTLPVTVPSTTTLPVTSKVQSFVPSTSNEPSIIPESPLGSTIIQEGIDKSTKVESFDKLMSRSFCDTIEDLVRLDNSTTRLVLAEIENDCLNNSPSPQSKSWNVFLNNDV